MVTLPVHHIRNGYIAGFLILLLGHSLYASQDDYIVDNIPLKGELSSFSGTCIMQDSEGFIWFGSKDGLYRYNSKGFKVFRNDPSDLSSLSSSTVFAMIEDHLGMIWIGTKGGFNRFDKQTETFDRCASVYMTSPHGWGFSTDEICEDQNGDIWMATYQGFCKFNRSDSTYSFYVIPRANQRNMKFDIRIWGVYPDSENNIWIRGEADVYRFNIQSDSIDRYIRDIGFITKIIEITPGQLWIAGSMGLFTYDIQSGSLDRLLYDPDDPGYLTNQHIRALLFSKSGHIWIRTLDGIYCYNRELKPEYYIMHSQVYTETPDYVNISKTLFEDNNQNIWFFSKDGINRITRKPTNFMIYDPDPSNNSFMDDVALESKGMIWIAALNGIYHLERPGNRFILHYGTDYDEASHEFDANAICVDSRGDIWFGMSYTGLIRMNRSEDSEIQFRNYPPQFTDGGIIDQQSLYLIEDLFEDSQGRLWIGNRNGDPIFYDLGQDRFKHLVNNTEAQTVLPGERFQVHHESGDGFLWAVSKKGVYKIILPLIDVDESRVMPTDLFNYTNRDLGMLNDYFWVNTSFLDSKGSLWLGINNGGLHNITEVKNPEDPHGAIAVKSYYMTDGLPDNSIMSIIEDDNGSLWIGTDNGLSRFDPENETFKNYFVRNGLPINEFRPGSVTKDTDGELFFGTRKGLISFYPDSLIFNEYVAPVKLTGFKIHNREIVSGNNSFMKKSITYSGRIALRYDQNHLSFEFAVLNYQEPELNQYKYRLEGFEDDWIYSGSRNYAIYSNLDPGTYRFRVTGANNDGLWNLSGTSLDIIIRPPPWLRWYAYLVYFILAGGISVWIWRYIVNRARIKTAVKAERIEKEKMMEIDAMKSRFFANVSHEFRTPLTLLQGPLEELRKNMPVLSGENRNLIQTIQRNLVRIRQLVGQLLDISKLETGQVKVGVEEGNLSEFVRTIVQSFLSLAESKKIDYEYNIEVQPCTVYFDRDKLEKILTNLITNAFKFTYEGGKVTVDLKFTLKQINGAPGFTEISVSDTGLGIPEEEKARIFERFYQISSDEVSNQEGTGIGLALTRELVELYHGEINLESVVGKGSKFTVILPVFKESFNEDEIMEAPIVGEQLNGAAPVPQVDPRWTISEEKELSVRKNKAPVILVVEDNYDLRKYICRNLKYNYHILEEDNGRKGFQTAIMRVPDLIITDLMMPELDGIELCKQLREDDRTNHIPVIMLTARADRKSKLEGLETGADDYLVKPFDPKELKIRIANLIRQRQLIRAKFMYEFRDRTLGESKEIISDGLLNKVMDVLMENLKNPDFNIDWLPAMLNMSRSQMFRKIRALTGNGPGDLLRLIRLKKAAELLLREDLNIAQVTFEVGLQSPAYFSKKFKAYYGMKPAEYRKTLISGA